MYAYRFDTWYMSVRKCMKLVVTRLSVQLKYNRPVRISCCAHLSHTNVILQHVVKILQVLDPSPSWKLPSLHQQSFEACGRINTNQHKSNYTFIQSQLSLMNPRGESVWLPHEPRCNLDSWKTAGGCVASGATLSNINSVYWETHQWRAAAAWAKGRVLHHAAVFVHEPQIDQQIVHLWSPTRQNSRNLETKRRRASAQWLNHVPWFFLGWGSVWLHAHAGIDFYQAPPAST